MFRYQQTFLPPYLLKAIKDGGSSPNPKNIWVVRKRCGSPRTMPQHVKPHSANIDGSSLLPARKFHQRRQLHPGHLGSRKAASQRFIVGSAFRLRTHRLRLPPSIARRPLLIPPLIRKGHGGSYGYSRGPKQEFVTHLLIAQDALNSR
ncbi:hypothetical protein [Mesorhizobium sp. WSM2239]|uniref:Uncharacterized protein n=2 Tax=unclassified Mesorhizobium TaxID=325217 RepID=A0AAU8D5Z6_9HYPH